MPASPRARRVALVAAVSGALCALAFGVGGAAGLAGVAVAMALLAAFLLGGRLPFLFGPGVPRGVLFLLVGLNYVTRIALLLVAMVVLGDATWLHPQVFGLTLIGGALLWSFVQLVGHMRSGGEETPGEEVPREGAHSAASPRNDSDDSGHAVPSPAPVAGKEAG